MASEWDAFEPVEDPALTPKLLTFYYPQTPESTRRAGLNPKVEGGVTGGPGFGNVDLRNYTLEKYDESDPKSVVAVAQPGKPTGKIFPLNIGGRTVRAWNVDTGGGLSVGQIDVATENPQLAKHNVIRPGQSLDWSNFEPVKSKEQDWSGFEPVELPSKQALATGGTHAPSPPTALENLPPEENRLVRIIEDHRIAAGKEGIYPKAQRATEADKEATATVPERPPATLLGKVGDYLRDAHFATDEDYRKQIGSTIPTGKGITEPLYQPKRIEAGQDIPDVFPVTGLPTGTTHKAGNLEAAATNMVNGVLSGATSVKGLLEMLPPVFLAETLYNAPSLYRQIQEAEKTPAFSQERWEAGLTVVGTLGTLGLMGHALVNNYMSAAPKEVADRIGGETDAVKRSDAQVQARETPQREQARAKGEEPKTGRGDNVKREAQRVEPERVPPEAPEVRGEQTGLVEKVNTQLEEIEKARELQTPIAQPILAQMPTITDDALGPDRAQVFGFDEQVRKAAMSKAGGLEPSSAQSLGITPFDPFAKDLGQKISEVTGTFTKAAKQVRAIFSPADASKEAAVTSRIIRAHEGELARKWEMGAAAVKDTMRIFNRQNNRTNLDVIDKMEKGQPTDPRFDSYRALRKQAYDERIEQVQKLNPNALQNLIEDYFPHIWTKESVDRVKGAAASIPSSNPWAAIFGKRPLTGPKSFLKQRSIPDTMTGVSIGLEPVTFNPVELDMLKWHEMDRYIAGQKIIQEMKDRGLTKFIPGGGKPPPGYTQINDPIARVFAPKNWKIVDEAGRQVPGQKLLGHLYAPDDLARVLNNHLSPGLRGFAPYDALRLIGNTMNQVQLGLSLYHATFTAIDAVASTGALGIEQVARSGGNPVEIARGALNIARSLAEAPVGGGLIENIWRGSKFLKEYSKPGSTNERLAKIVDAAQKGNVRVRMDKFYGTGAVKSFANAIKAGNYGGALLRLPFAVLEGAAKPLMEYTVPRMKAGINSQRIGYELSKLPVNATEDQVRTVVNRVIDSTENRMGQMTYDNIFWHKTLKDLLMLGVRSVGWNLGDIRELGGGALDTIKTPYRMYKNIANPEVGANPVMTTKMAYLMYYPFIVGSLGAMYQYLKTGEGPKELSDYFMPRTGRMNPDGSPERVMLPTYMKDIAPLAVAAGRRGAVGFTSRLGTMIQHKIHPFFNMLSQMWQNKDYYGTEIRHEGDNLVQSLKKEAAFVLKQFQPFSFSGFEKREGGPVEKTEAIIGIMPASHELTMSAAEELAHKYYIDQLPQGARTQEQAQLSKEKSGMVDKIRKGDYSDLQKAVQSGRMSQRAALNLAKRAQVNPLEYQMQRLTPDQAMDVWKVATKPERTKLGPLIRNKILRSKTLGRERTIEYLNELSL